MGLKQPYEIIISVRMHSSIHIHPSTYPSSYLHPSSIHHPSIYSPIYHPSMIYSSITSYLPQYICQQCIHPSTATTQKQSTSIAIQQPWASELIHHPSISIHPASPSQPATHPASQQEHQTEPSRAEKEPPSDPSISIIYQPSKNKLSI